MVDSIKDLDDILATEAHLSQAEKAVEPDKQMVAIQQEMASNERAIPEEIEDALFFLYMNGLSFDEIVKKYEKSDTPFNKKQLYRYSHKHGWAQRKDSILKETKSEFSDMIKFGQAKKMTAISMAVQSVADMIIRDVADLRKDPQTFWREVNDMLRPRPFWLARNVDELTGLFKLQKSLEEGIGAMTDDGGIADADRAALLKALATAANAQAEALNSEGKVVDAEVVPDVGSKQDK